MTRRIDEHDATRCACVHPHAFECWRIRYQLPLSADIHEDGGPCQCVCHDEVDESEYDGEDLWP